MDMITHMYIKIFAIILLSGNYAISFAETHEVAAHVLGVDVYYSEISPSGNVISPEKLFHERTWRLNRKIWEIVHEYAYSMFGTKPTESEIDSYQKHMENQAKISGVPLMRDHEWSSQISRSMYAGFVRSWKLSKALYEKYGGIVIFQQSNPLEPVGAFKLFFEDLERQNKFKIYDKDLYNKFWSYYLLDHAKKALGKDKIDFSTPWWDNQSK